MDRNCINNNEKNESVHVLENDESSESEFSNCCIFEAIILARLYYDHIETYGLVSAQKNQNFTPFRIRSRHKGEVQNLLDQWLRYCSVYEVLPRPNGGKSIDTFGGVPQSCICHVETCFRLSITIMSRCPNIVAKYSGGIQEEKKISNRLRSNNAIVMRRGICKSAHTDGIGIIQIPPNEVQKLFTDNTNYFPIQNGSQGSKFYSVYLDCSQIKTKVPLPELSHKSDNIDLHVKFIKNMQKYAKSFFCTKCCVGHASLFSLRRHEGNCTGGVKVQFKSGIFSASHSILDKLVHYGVPPEIIPELDCQFVIWDLETFTPDTYTTNHDICNSLHEAMSFSLCSDIKYCYSIIQKISSNKCVRVTKLPKGTCCTKHINHGGDCRPLITGTVIRRSPTSKCSQGPTSISQFVKILTSTNAALSKLSYKFNKIKFRKVFAYLISRAKKEQRILNKYKCENKGLKRKVSYFFTLRSELKEYLRRAVNLTFNGSSYDLRVIKKELFSSFNLRKRIRPRGYHSSKKKRVYYRNNKEPDTNAECTHSIPVSNNIHLKKERKKRLKRIVCYDDTSDSDSDCISDNSDNNSGKSEEYDIHSFEENVEFVSNGIELCHIKEPLGYNTHSDSSTDTDASLNSNSDLEEYAIQLSQKEHSDRFISIIKRKTIYLQIMTQNCIYRDMMFYESPGTKMADVLDAYSLPPGTITVTRSAIRQGDYDPTEYILHNKIGKGHFPYNYVKNLNDLDEVNFPTHEQFSNVLNNNQSISLDDYNGELAFYTQNTHMNTFRDYLRSYNENDVFPLAHAARQKVCLYNLECKDTLSKPQFCSLFKDFVSLPGASLNLASLSKRQDYEFFIPTHEVQPILREGVIGGLSLICRRYHNDGKNKANIPSTFPSRTYIRNNTDYPFKNGIIYDANSLYLSSFASRLAVGPAILRIAPNFDPVYTQTRAKSTLPQSSHESLEWLLFIQSNVPKLQFSGGGMAQEVKLASYNVDGYDPISNTIYEFYGCLIHGCLICFKGDDPNPIINSKTNYELQHDRIRRENILKGCGHSFLPMWSCKWKDLKRTSRDVKSFLDNSTDIRIMKKKFKPVKGCSESIALEHIVNNRIFGFVKCNVRHRDPQSDTTFNDLPPVIKNINVGINPKNK